MSFILPGGLGQIAVVSGGPPSTLDPATVGGNTNGILSSGNMVFTANGGQSMVCGQRFRNSGKFYFEFQVLQIPTTTGNQAFGAGIGGSNAPGYFIGGGSSWAILEDYSTGYWYNCNNSGLGVSMNTTPQVGDTIQVAMDMTSTTNMRIYLGLNNSWFPGFGAFTAASPTYSGLSTGASYTYYPQCSVTQTYGTASLQFANRTALFNYTPPAGFSPWN